MSGDLPGPEIEAFEALRFDVGSFNHEAHVCVAWRYLQQYDLLESINRYRRTLKQLTRRIGVPEKYNETITWFFVIAIAERLTPETTEDWDAFKATNPELFTSKPGLIRKFYSASRLGSEAAKIRFLLPDVCIAADCN